MQRLWYVAYGSNLSVERFRRLPAGWSTTRWSSRLSGVSRPTRTGSRCAVDDPGRHGASPGSRRSGVAAWRCMTLALSGEVAARGYLITAEQFTDVFSQEIRLEPGMDFNLTPVHETGGHSLGPGQYETITHLGSHDDHPMLTFTSADVRAHPVTPPTENYLRTIALGLHEVHTAGSAPRLVSTWRRFRAWRVRGARSPSNVSLPESWACDTDLTLARRPRRTCGAGVDGWPIGRHVTFCPEPLHVLWQEACATGCMLAPMMSISEMQRLFVMVDATWQSPVADVAVGRRQRWRARRSGGARAASTFSHCHRMSTTRNDSCGSLPMFTGHTTRSE